MSVDFEIYRIKQVFKYGWNHAKLLAKRDKKSTIIIFIDILYCYHKYKLWSNSYVKENFHRLEKKQRQEVGMRYLEEGLKRDTWQKEYMENKKFLAKWTSRKYDPMDRVIKRNTAYAERFNAESGLFVESNVEISRSHYLYGTIKIGKNVLLAKNVFIDYTGHVQIDDDVKLTNGVVVLSHYNEYEVSGKGQDVNIQTDIHICEGAYIGTRAIILSSCHYIGKHACVGAGAVVTKDVPDYAFVAGVPAKIIKRQDDPQN